jgi:NADH-quinone oxidoreductase subunit J
MGTLLGVAAMFVLLGADFLGVVQLLVYVGGILVLTLFAVMLTSRVDVRVSNRSVGRLPALVVTAGVLAAMVHAIRTAAWVATEPAAPTATVYGIGHAFLGRYVLPFEIASLVLLVALIGAVVVSRKEVKE